jgi:hypothetical protein
VAEDDASQPLLTSRNLLPVTEVRTATDQAGALASQDLPVSQDLSVSQSMLVSQSTPSP